MAYLEAEKSVIGALLLNADEYAGTIFDRVIAEDFSNVICREIFKKSNELFMQNKKIDPVTVLAVMGSEYKEAIITCVDELPILSGISEYIQILREQSMRRRAEESLNDLAKLVETGGLTECQEKAEKICSILGSTENQKIITPIKGFSDFFATKNKPKTYIKTGFSMIDKYSFIDLGDYVIIGGRPSSGKTAFALELMSKMSESYNTAFFSLETSGSKIIDRMMSANGKIPLSNIKRQEMTDEDWTSAAKASDGLVKKKFSIVEASGMNVSQIRAKVLQLKAQIIFIDYLSLIVSDGKSLYEKVTNISISLHNLAQQLKVTVFALAQLNRAGTGEPEMTSLRESGQIEQDADLILFLYDPEPNEQGGSGKRICKIAKNKEGETGSVPFAFYGNIQKFYEEERRYG